MIKELIALLEEGDIIVVNGGNSYYEDTIPREVKIVSRPGSTSSVAASPVARSVHWRVPR